MQYIFIWFVLLLDSQVLFSLFLSRFVLLRAVSRSASSGGACSAEKIRLCSFVLLQVTKWFCCINNQRLHSSELVLHIYRPSYQKLLRGVLHSHCLIQLLVTMRSWHAYNFFIAQSTILRVERNELRHHHWRTNKWWYHYSREPHLFYLSTTTLMSAVSRHRCQTARFCYTECQIRLRSLATIVKRLFPSSPFLDVLGAECNLYKSTRLHTIVYISEAPALQLLTCRGTLYLNIHVQWIVLMSASQVDLLSVPLCCLQNPREKIDHETYTA